MRLESSFFFQAAHHLPNHPGPCDQVHGHRYELTVSIEGGVDPTTGMVVDFFTLDQIVQDHLIHRLDHRDLNLIMDLPTSEALVVWMWDILEEHLPGLHELTLREEPNHAVRFSKEKG